MKIRVMVVVLVLVAGCLGVLSCSKADSNAEKESGPEVFKVAYIARAQGDSFASWLANSIEKEADKYPNIEVDIMDGQAKDEVVNSYIENAITNKYDLIILQPNNDQAQMPYLQKVIAAGIPVITTNPRIVGMNGASSVDADPYEQAAVNARLAVEQVPKNAKVVVLVGPPGNMHSTVRRESWQKEFFDKRPDVQLVGEQIANWNKDEAMQKMEDWVQSIDGIAAVISMNDNMAAGAIEVVKNNPDYKNLLVYGVDGTAEAALLIEAGLLTSTSFQNAYELAKMNLKMANDILTGVQVGVADVDIDCPLITKENVSLLLDAHRATGAIK